MSKTSINGMITGGEGKDGRRPKGEATKRSKN